MYAIPIPGVRFTPPLPPRQAIAELSAWEERKPEGAVVLLERQGRSYRVVEIERSAGPFFAGLWVRENMFKNPLLFLAAFLDAVEGDGQEGGVDDEGTRGKGERAPGGCGTR